MNNELLQQVKENTWIFTDEEIINEYNKMQTYDYLFDGMKQDPGYVVLFLYKDKGTLSKEEYTSEVINYLYQESLDSKEDIDKTINKNLKWFYEYYEEALKDNDFFHTVQAARNNMISLLHY